MPRYVIRPDADRDLDEQADYYSDQAGIEIAIRFLDAAHETFRLLASQRLMGRAMKFRSSELAEARWQPLVFFTEHLVFYRSFQNGVEVLRVVHGKRNLLKLLDANNR